MGCALVSLYRMLHRNFYEKALFVKVDVATSLWWMQQLSVPFALCFYPHSRGAISLVARCIG
jgi:hypothetical protein